LRATTILDRGESSITFRVDDVELAYEPLDLLVPNDIIQTVTHLAPEASSDPATPLFPAHHHGLVATIRQASLDHRPLVLGPDAFWQAIAQGFADHVNANPEKLKAKVVPHAGKKKLVVPMKYLEREADNPWAHVMESFAKLVRKHAPPDATAALDVSFSTSSPVERVARSVVLMDSGQTPSRYEHPTTCGIPWVKLEGKGPDWDQIGARLEKLAGFGLDWWVAGLRPIVQELARTSRGVVDHDFWRTMFQMRDEGRPKTTVSGWIARLVPYVGMPRQRNPLVLGKATEIAQSALPSGIAQVPFVVKEKDGKQVPMFAFAGIFGMLQDRETLSLSPRILWAIARQPRQPSDEEEFSPEE
jgi:hypothetical protein